MSTVLILIVGVVVIFFITVFFGSPYVRSHKQPIETALDLLDLKEGDHLLDLGSGDGAVLLAAVKRGVRATGYELNPILWLVALWRTRKYRELVSVRWGDMWKVEINNQTKNIFIFLDMRFLKKLNKKIIDSGAKVKVVSYSYKIPGKKVLKTDQGMHLYEYGDV